MSLRINLILIGFQSIESLGRNVEWLPNAECSNKIWLKLEASANMAQIDQVSVIMNRAGI